MRDAYQPARATDTACARARESQRSARHATGVAGAVMALVPAALAAQTTVLPRPPQVQGQGTWQWAETEDAGAGAAVFEVAPADSAARLPGTAPTLRTGWLKLSGGLEPLEPPA